TRQSIEALYNIRSRCLHGAIPSDESVLAEDLDVVKQLLAAMLRAVLEWAVFKHVRTDEHADSEWSMELERATINKEKISRIPGVTIDLVEHLKTFVEVFRRDRLKAEWPDAEEQE